MTIGNGVTSIGNAAFSGCANLTNAYFFGDAPTMGNQVFYDSASGFTICYAAGAKDLHLPHGLATLHILVQNRQHQPLLFQQQQHCCRPRQPPRFSQQPPPLFQESQRQPLPSQSHVLRNQSMARIQNKQNCLESIEIMY